MGGKTTRQERKPLPAVRLTGTLGDNTRNYQMATLTALLNALHESLETSSADEIKRACELIDRVQNMDGGERDTLRSAFKQGPLWDGDVPSKEARTRLVSEGFMARVVVRGEDGFNACTYKGASAYRLIEAGA